MALEGIVDAVAGVVLVVGGPVLVALFVFEGLVVGKILQLPPVFVSVVALTRPSSLYLAGLIGACAGAVTLGQWILFRSLDPDATSDVAEWARSARLQALSTSGLERIGEDRLALVDRWFARFGALAVLVSTFLPLVRGTVAVPAGMSAYPQRRFLIVTLASNVAYFIVLAAIAFGLLRVLGW